MLPDVPSERDHASRPPEQPAETTFESAAVDAQPVPEPERPGDEVGSREQDDADELEYRADDRYRCHHDDDRAAVGPTSGGSPGTPARRRC